MINITIIAIIIKLHILYFFGFGCIVAGTIVYSVSSTKSRQITAEQPQNRRDKRKKGQNNKHEQQRTSIEMTYIRENLQIERF